MTPSKPVKDFLKRCFEQIDTKSTDLQPINLCIAPKELGAKWIGEHGTADNPQIIVNGITPSTHVDIQDEPENDKSSR